MTGNAPNVMPDLIRHPAAAMALPKPVRLRVKPAMTKNACYRGGPLLFPPH